MQTDRVHGGVNAVYSGQWRRQDFVTGGEVRYWSIGGLEYEVPQKLTHLLQCICHVIRVVP